MKDEIKNALAKVLWAINIPFFLVRLLIAGVPIFIGLYIAFHGTRKDVFMHLWCCILGVLWISGPIGLLHDYCRYKWWGIGFKDYVDDIEELFEEWLDK